MVAKSRAIQTTVTVIFTEMVDIATGFRWADDFITIWSDGSCVHTDGRGLFGAEAVITF